jgi:tRNA nucleotidyltransferase (CCA-adding enzyme)
MIRVISGRNLLRRLPRKRLSLLRELGALADERGVSLYLVGGVVRDLLLARKNWDLDLAVEGDGISFARLVADRFRAGLALFERFATARLVLPNGLKMDIATTRRESYAKAAVLPDVAPASLQEDLYRRDFTINAMAIQLNPAKFGQLHDPYGGQHDLRAKTIRVLHEGSFVDDPTRIFRAIRFAQRFGFSLESSTRRLLEEAAATDLIQLLSGPRLCSEVLRLLGERDPAKLIKTLVVLRLLRFLHPRLRYTQHAQRVVAVLPRALAWWKKQCPAHKVEQPLVYFMALLSDVGPSVSRAVSQRLQLSSAQSRAVTMAGQPTSRIARALLQGTDLRPSRVYRLLEAIPDEALVLALAKGMLTKSGKATRRLQQRISRFVRRDRKVVITVRGDDLKQLGLPPGPRFKKIFERLLDARLDGEVKTSMQEIDMVRRLARLSA